MSEETKDKFEEMKASLDARLGALVDRHKATPKEELAGPQNFWDVFAIGPYQNYGLEPARVIE